jgi:hypoxanthine phosphoribosyltransferase
MRSITLHNKTFEVFIAETEIAAIVHSMANQINNSEIKNPLFIAVLNGSFLFAADIMRKINIPNSEISFIKLSSYLGTESTGEVNELIGLGKNIRNRNNSSR